jgi:hypothetical protein
LPLLRLQLVAGGSALLVWLRRFPCERLLPVSESSPEREVDDETDDSEETRVTSVLPALTAAADFRCARCTRRWMIASWTDVRRCTDSLIATRALREQRHGMCEMAGFVKRQRSVHPERPRPSWPQLQHMVVEATAH